MQVKRFFAADMRQAMKLVRDELGADAAIIGNRRIAGGVELTAALDYALSALAPRVPNIELEDELRKTQSRIVSAQAELSNRSDSDGVNNRQLFAGLPLTASEPLVEPHFTEAPRAPAAAAAAQPAVDQSSTACANCSKCNSARWPGPSCRVASRIRPTSGGACSASVCPARCRANCCN
jgi:flagellar biosynthesis protein FlhF